MWGKGYLSQKAYNGELDLVSKIYSEANFNAISGSILVLPELSRGEVSSRRRQQAFGYWKHSDLDMVIVK